MSKYTIELQNDAQAKVLTEALDLYVRVRIGQLGAVTQMARSGQIPYGNVTLAKEFSREMDALQTVEDCINGAKQALGHPSNGNHGIGHKDVADDTKRAYELMKTLDKVIAQTRDPNPSMRGVNYDGVLVRYTQDELPVVTADNALVASENFPLEKAGTVADEIPNRSKISPDDWLTTAIGRTEPNGFDWQSGRTSPLVAGWYDRYFTDGCISHYWDGKSWRSGTNEPEHWRQVGDYPAWRNPKV